MPPVSCLFDALLKEYPDEEKYITRKRQDLRAASFYEALFYLFVNHRKEQHCSSGTGTLEDLLITKAGIIVNTPGVMRFGDA
jgi:hypothetical protein